MVSLLGTMAQLCWFMVTTKGMKLNLRAWMVKLWLWYPFWQTKYGRSDDGKLCWQRPLPTI